MSAAKPSIEALLEELAEAGVQVRSEGEQLRIRAPQGTLTMELKSVLAARKGELLAHLSRPRSVAAAPWAATPLAPAPRDGDLPLSFAQQGLWLVDQLEGGSANYNMPGSLRFTGALDGDALKRALSEVVRRHEALRTTFASRDGVAYQAVAETVDLEIPFEDLSAASEEEGREMLQRRCLEEAREAFDLTRGPLLRARLLRLAEDSHLLLVTVHHIVSDAWSLGLLIQEVIALYGAFTAGRPSPLEAVPLQYGDYAVWQRRWLTGEVRESQLAYWKERLDGAPSLLELPTDRPRPPVQSFRGAVEGFTLPGELMEGLRRVGRESGATLFMVLLAAFQSLLARLTGQEDISVGTPVSNRRRRELETVLGFFVNTVVQRTRFEGDPTFREVLARVRQGVIDSQPHQDVPFEQVVEALRPERNLAYAPLFQVMLIFLQNTPLKEVELPGVKIRPAEMDNETAKFDLSLTLEETREALRGEVEYSTDLFEAATIRRFIAYLETLLCGVVDDPERPVSHLPLLPEEERRRLLVEWNRTETKVPRDASLTDLLEEQAARTPDRPAVELYGEVWSYRELHERANRLARYLRRHGVGPETVVGIALERSLELAAAVLGVLKAGAAYVPLDAEYPKERLAYMLEDSRTAVLLTQERLLPVLPTSARAVCLDRDWGEIAEESAEPLVRSTGPDDLVYVIYTSGSTGRPKGVAMRHGPMVNLMAFQIPDGSFTPESRVLQFAPFSFDVSVQELFATWCSGGSLVLISEGDRKDPVALLKHLVAERVEKLFITFIGLQQLAEVAEREGIYPEALRLVMSAGEQLQISPAVEAFFRRLPDCTLFNHYGPGEAHLVTSYRLSGSPESWPRLPPVGRQLANSRFYVCDRNLEPVALGVPGELLIGGETLARGYLHRPGLTAERFVPDPWGLEPGARLYRSGDLVRYLPDGELVFLGRIDHQVKLRGYRIELGEVETELARHGEVREAVALVREDRPGDRRLVAYAVAQEGSSLDAGALRSFLKERLPEFMVPSAFVFLDALPVNPSGKIDRRALPAPEGSREAVGLAYVAPRTETEITLAEIWAAVLDLDRVGVADNFFELGGQSLLATQVSFRVRQALGVELPLRELFEEPTVEGLARRIETLRWAAGQTEMAAAGEREEGAL